MPSDPSIPVVEAKNLWKEYGGYFIGIGYVFPQFSETRLRQACRDANLPLYELPIEEPTFEDYVQSHKLDYLAQLKMKKQLIVHTQPDKQEKLVDEIAKIEQTITRQEKAKVVLETVQSSHYEELLESLSEERISEEIKNVSPGIRTGYVIHNTPLNLEGGEISVVAAPTGHGKTSFLINALSGILSSNENSRVYFFSYEESLGPLFCLSLNQFINEPFSDNNRAAILDYFRAGSLESIYPEKRELFLEKKSLFFSRYIASRRLNLAYCRYFAEELVGAIRFLAKKDRPTAICIDYMQMLRLKEAFKGMSRQEELKHICFLLKDCALETGLPILIAAQFNRTVQSEEELLAQAIGEAGDIERVASLIIGLWNRRFSREQPQDMLYAKILKARHLPTGGEEIFGFDGNRCKIENRVKRTFHDIF